MPKNHRESLLVSRVYLNGLTRTEKFLIPIFVCIVILLKLWVRENSAWYFNILRPKVNEL